MDVMSITEAARFGMNYERARVEAASQNLALANVAYASAAEAQNAAEVISNSMFEMLSGISSTASQAKKAEMGSQVKTVYDPSNPHADAKGNVFYVNVDPVKEMATLVSAVRAYEANVRAYNTNGEMNRSALSIGER